MSGESERTNMLILYSYNYRGLVVKNDTNGSKMYTIIVEFLFNLKLVYKDRIFRVL